MIGVEQALRLVGSLPQAGAQPWRRIIYIPAKLTLDHHLVRVLGWPDAQRLVYEFRGIILHLSTCHHLVLAHRNRAIHAAAAQGATHEQLGVAFGLTTRQIANVLAERPTEDARGREAHRGSSKPATLPPRRPR